jgi:hypothetical protein
MGDLFRADYRPPSLGQNTAEQLDALIRGLPQLSQALNKEVLPTEQANLAAQQAVAPGQQALNTQLYGTYGPQIAKISSDIAAQQSAADARNLAGPGQDLARAGLAAQQIADPEYYKTRALLGQKTGDLLNSIDVNGLSGSERAEVERRLNQEAQQGGSPDISSGIKTVENASMFGSALQNKRNSLGQAITQATNFLPTAKSGVDVFQQVTGRPSGPSAAQATSAEPVGATANNLTNQLFGNIGLTQGQTQDIMAARKSGWQNADPVTKVCCFIFLESYNGILPWWVRKCRDRYYDENPTMAIGYNRTANILVPLMQRFSLVRELVNHFMVTPLTEYGAYLYAVKGYEHGKNKVGYKNFWFFVWKTLGKI